MIGLASLITVALLLGAPGQIPAEARAAIVDQFRTAGLISIPVPVIERAATLVVHVLSSVLLVYAVQLRQQRWFWLAFAYKTAIDGFAGWAILAWHVSESAGKIAAVQPVFVLFAVVAMAAMPKLKAGFARLDQPSRP